MLYSTAVVVPQGYSMAKCPKCKKEVSTPKKTWKMAGRKKTNIRKTRSLILFFSVIPLLTVLPEFSNSY